MKIPFLVQTAGSLIGAAVLVGMAYQSLAASDANHDRLIQQNTDNQAVVEEEVTLIRISLSSIVTNQENQEQQTERVINLLERLILPNLE